MSPPMRTGTCRSQMRVPNRADSGTDGTQYRSRPGSRYGLMTTTFAPPRLGQMEVLGEHRLVVGRVGTPQHDQIRLDHVAQRAGRGGDSDAALQADRGRCMAHTSRRIDVRGAECPSRFAGHVVGLVGEPARGQVQRYALWCGSADRGAEHVEGLGPCDAGEPGFTTSAPHRVREATHRPQLRRVALGQRLTSAMSPVVERTHRVEAQQLQSRGAQVHAVHRPVVQAGHAQRASVAHAAGQHLPGVSAVWQLFSGDAQHVAVVTRLLLGHTVG